MQHLVVQQVVQQRMRHGVGTGGEEHRCALHPMRRLRADAADEQRQRQGRFIQALDNDLASALPGGHEDEQRNTGDHRERPALEDLRRVGGKVQAVDQQETQQQRHCQPAWGLPQQQHHCRREQCSDQHGARHRHPVSRRQGTGGFEADHQQHHTDHQRPVHRADVDLPLFLARGVLDEHARHIAELDGLAGQREGAGNHCLGGNDGRQGGKPDHRQQCPVRRQQIERVTHRLGVAEDQCALAEVVQHQAWQHQQNPGAGNRFAAKVAHVGIQRFGTGQGQHYGTQNRHTDTRVHHEELHRPGWIHSQQHFRALDDAVHTQCAQHAEPQDHDRPEQDTDTCGPVFLDQEQGHQHHHGDRHHPMPDAIKRQLQALHCRQHRNCRGDHAVAVEQRRAKQAEQHQHPA
ncbi:hypothetical protein D3C81_798720 [compost metagenome]